MMHFEYHKKSSEALENALKSNLFSMEGLSDESILARYYLLLYFNDTYQYFPQLKNGENGEPLSFLGKNNETFFWSLSHSEEYVAFMISEEKCGIDIAEILPRSRSLFDVHTDFEYDLLGEKNWNNFYVLWTAKEAIIKKCGIFLDDMKQIRLIGNEASSYLFEFQKKTHTITTIVEPSLCISYTN